MSYSKWCKEMTYYRGGLTEATMKEIMLDFFHSGITPLIHKCGYSWSEKPEMIAEKFVQFAYMVSTSVKDSSTLYLQAPQPNHRNLPEDRETFDMYFDTTILVNFLDSWKCYNEIVGTRLEFLIKEFCYIWVNVIHGTPGKWTQVTLDMNKEQDSEDEFITTDANWRKEKHDLY